jgi:plasmid stabilization system protein ParE
MDCAVVYSERSLSDLHDITAFIAADSAAAAVTFANRLLDLAESPRRMPERGRPVKN